jgi:hypothetical protein
MDVYSVLMALALGACVLTFIVSLCVGLYGHFLVRDKMESLLSREEERSLNWSERVGLKNSRMNSFFDSEESKQLRRLLLGSIMGILGSAGLFWLLRFVARHWLYDAM